ncbi:hypothetical protein BRETT_005322 [Brettanomyces bruxellensis]|uniref:Uncharacterized protein n=1 Tax=Dekkera bruxellensis TaxID=5007 RepID=A0A871R811_DEKBR|nr:uncharacterized protein BRETT_005322 [Brettanomyces bruxellensis]QOU18260.1 hypothetical protein BRETT_005322 [Brettanomyces bruxellensis]
MPPHNNRNNGQDNSFMDQFTRMANGEIPILPLPANMDEAMGNMVDYLHEICDTHGNQLKECSKVINQEAEQIKMLQQSYNCTQEGLDSLIVEQNETHSWYEEESRKQKETTEKMIASLTTKMEKREAEMDKRVSVLETASKRESKKLNDRISAMEKKQEKMAKALNERMSKLDEKMIRTLDERMLKLNEKMVKTLGERMSKLDEKISRQNKQKIEEEENKNKQIIAVPHPRIEDQNGKNTELTNQISNAEENAQNLLLEYRKLEECLKSNKGLTAQTAELLTKFLQETKKWTDEIVVWFSALDRWKMEDKKGKEALGKVVKEEFKGMKELMEKFTKAETKSNIEALGKLTRTENKALRDLLERNIKSDIKGTKDAVEKVRKVVESNQTTTDSVGISVSTLAKTLLEKNSKLNTTVEKQTTVQEKKLSKINETLTRLEKTTITQQHEEQIKKMDDLLARLDKDKQKEKMDKIEKDLGEIKELKAMIKGLVESQKKQEEQVASMKLAASTQIPGNSILNGPSTLSGAGSLDGLCDWSYFMQNAPPGFPMGSQQPSPYNNPGFNGMGGPPGLSNTGFPPGLLGSALGSATAKLRSEQSLQPLSATPDSAKSSNTSASSVKNDSKTKK